MVKHTVINGDYKEIYEASTVPELIELLKELNKSDEVIPKTHPSCACGQKETIKYIAHVTGMTEKQVLDCLERDFHKIPKGMIII